MSETTKPSASEPPKEDTLNDKTELNTGDSDKKLETTKPNASEPPKEDILKDKTDTAESDKMLETAKSSATEPPKEDKLKNKIDTAESDKMLESTNPNSSDAPKKDTSKGTTETEPKGSDKILETTKPSSCDPSKEDVAIVKADDSEKNIKIQQVTTEVNVEKPEKTLEITKPSSSSTDPTKEDMLKATVEVNSEKCDKVLETTKASSSDAPKEDEAIVIKANDAEKTNKILETTKASSSDAPKEDKAILIADDAEKSDKKLETTEPSLSNLSNASTVSINLEESDITMETTKPSTSNPSNVNSASINTETDIIMKPTNSSSSEPPKEDTPKTNTGADTENKDNTVKEYVKLEKSIEIEDDDVEIIDLEDKPIVIDDDEDDIPTKSALIKAGIQLDGSLGFYEDVSGESVYQEKNVIEGILKIHELEAFNLHATANWCSIMDPKKLMPLLDMETRDVLSKMESYVNNKTKKAAYVEIMNALGIESSINNPLIGNLWKHSGSVKNPFMRLWPVEGIHSDDGEDKCKVLYLIVPPKWGYGHVKALLDVGTIFDANARQVKMQIIFTNYTLREFLLRFQSYKESSLVHDQLKNLQILCTPYEVSYDIGYVKANKCNILKEKFDVNSKAQTNHKALIGIDRARRLLIMKNRLKTIVQAALREKNKKDNLKKQIDNNKQNTATIIEKASERQNPEANRTNAPESDGSAVQTIDESAPVRCRILHITNMKNAYSIKKYSEKFHNVHIKQLTEKDAVAICPTHEQAVKIMGEMNGYFAEDGSTIGVKLDVGHIVSKHHIQSLNNTIETRQDVTKLPKYNDPRINVFSMNALRQMSPLITRDKYGLNKSFFKGTVSTPYSNCVVVKNLHPELTESQVRDIFSLAGIIRTIQVEKKCTKIVYDHPLEAIQAVSMFNSQIIFNEKVSVEILTGNCHPMPFGLQTIGPGLGKSGEPLSNVRAMAEIKEIHRHLADMGRMQKIFRNDGPFAVEYGDRSFVPGPLLPTPHNVDCPPNFPNQGGPPNFPNQDFSPGFPNQGCPPNFPNQGFRPDFPNQGFRPDFPIQGPRPDFRNQGFRPDFPNANFQPNFPIQGFRPEFPNRDCPPNQPNQDLPPVFPNQDCPPNPNQLNPRQHDSPRSPNNHNTNSFDVKAIALGAILAQHGLINKNERCDSIDSILEAIGNKKHNTDAEKNDNNARTTPLSPNNEETNVEKVSDSAKNAKTAPNFSTNIEKTTAEKDSGPPPAKIAKTAPNSSPANLQQTNKNKPSTGNKINTVPVATNAQNNPKNKNSNPNMPGGSKPKKGPNKAGRPGQPSERQGQDLPGLMDIPPTYPWTNIDHSQYNPGPSDHNQYNASPDICPPPPSIYHCVPDPPPKTSKPSNTTTSQPQHDHSVVYNPHLRDPRLQSRPSDDYASRDPRKRQHDEVVSDLLSFSNLPSSVSIDALHSKMLEVGDVGLCEMTGRGRAVVRFRHQRDAERCIRLFHHSKVNGQVIDVTYV